MQWIFFLDSIQISCSSLGRRKKEKKKKREQEEGFSLALQLSAVCTVALLNYER